MKRLTYLLVALALILAIFPASVFAVNDSADTAIVLTAENAGHADQLVGNTGGAGRFYRIDYAGNAQPVKIDVTAIPGQNTSGKGFGFKLYGPEGLVGEAPIEQNESTWTRYSITLSSAIPGSYLVLVYNYTDGMVIDYNIQAAGLASATAQEQPSEPVGLTPDQPLVVAQRAGSIGGSLLGKSDGAAQFFSLDYPGGGSSLNANLKYSPPSPFQNRAIGLRLYRSNGDLVAEGGETQRDGSSATVSFTYSDDAGGTYLLQVSSFQPDLLINYVLSIEGGAGSVQQAADNTRPETAMVLTGSAPAAQGTLSAGGEASFNYFLFDHPGGNTQITIRMMVEAADGIGDKQVGFNLYQGSDLAAHEVGGLNSKGDTRVAAFTAVEGSPVTFGLQVFNYSTSANAKYKLYVTGLP